MVITTTCPMCGDTEDIYTPSKNYIDWKDGTLIQNAMPLLDTDDRERLMSGICPACFDKMFEEEDHTEKITAEQFTQAVGRPPEDDDLERCNCDHVGETGHWCCGWCDKHNKPVFICGCVKIKK